MDSRKLIRIESSYSTELKISILFENDEVSNFSVKDYNSVGISIACEDVELFLKKKAISLAFYYGTVKIGEMRQPKLIRSSIREKKVVFSISEKSIRDFFERDLRVNVFDTLSGAISVDDPVKLNALLHFKIEQISQGGARISTSKSNRHLLPGISIKMATMYLPCIGFVEDCSFDIVYVDVTEDRLCVGIKFNNLNEVGRNKIINYLILNVNSESEVKFFPKQKHKFNEAIRIERASSEEQLQKVAKVRFLAYKDAGKIFKDTTESTMLDKYDKHSIILLSNIGPKTVGTVRLVFGEKDSKFPFEEYFPFQIVGKYQRRQITEVSRLAIDPAYQGTDLLLKLFQGFAVEAMTKDCLASVCLATSKLAPYYLAIGAKKISHEVAHPQIEDETLAMYLFEQKKFGSGKMSAIAWFGFAKATVLHISKFGFLKRLPFDFLKYPELGFSLAKMRLKKIFNIK